MHCSGTWLYMQLKLNGEEPRSTKKIHMKKALQKNNNGKEQGNAEKLPQENNSLRNKVQVWWHKSILLAFIQGTVMASFVLEAIKKKLSRPIHAYT